MTVIGHRQTPSATPDRATAPSPALRSRGALRSLGVEEEFHLVDLVTRQVSPRGPELLRALADGTYVAEMQSCMVETNTEVVVTLPELRSELLTRRAVLRKAAREKGLGALAAGTAPLVGPTPPPLTDAPRYRWMREEYAVLADEQLICGTHVHVELPDRDEAVAVAGLIAPYLPVLLALSASSPYDARGRDTGYASSRTLVWSRWPTGGTAGVTTAAEYDALVAELVGSGVALDEGMMYFDIRPALRTPTLELRLCDSCPSIDTIVLITGLYRALVERAIEDLRAGARPIARHPALGRAAIWRAARHGLSGDLLDPLTGQARPADAMVTELIRALEPQLRRTDDLRLVWTLARAAIAAGTSADRQRRAYAVRGRLTDVVDQVLAETASVAALGDGSWRAADGDDVRCTTTGDDVRRTAGVIPAGDPSHIADAGTSGSARAPGHPSEASHVVTYDCPVGCGPVSVTLATGHAPTLFRCPRCGGPATRSGAGSSIGTTAPSSVLTCDGPAGIPGRFGWRPRPPRAPAPVPTSLVGTGRAQGNSRSHSPTCP